MLRKKLKVKEIWQHNYGTWMGRQEWGDGTPQNTIHLGSYTIHYEGKIIGNFDIAVVDDCFETAKIHVPLENRWGVKAEAQKGEWQEVTRIRLDTVKEITCSVIGTHSISACSGCKYRRAWTDHYIDCTCLDVRCNPEGSC